MAVITISRQMGSLGSEVARAVAGQLGYRLLWRELINQAAIRCGSPEMALVVIDELNLMKIHAGRQDFERYLTAVSTVVHEAAEEGNVVIVGRASQVLLHGFTGALHVRVVAPFQLRVERVARYRGISMDAARELVATSDRNRKEYLERWHQVDWADPELYDLVLNTGRMEVDSCARIICYALACQE